MTSTTQRDGRKIVVCPDGPYEVQGDIPLTYKRQVVSEHGEPLTWATGPTIETDGTYALCRCGHSTTTPFCSGAHRAWGFDGTETAETGPTTERQVAFDGGTGILVRKDPSLCTDAGFCGMRGAGIRQLVQRTSETAVRSLVVAMVERCPSGSLTYALDEAGEDIEPDLPARVGVVTEITSDGPIEGPLWVTGGIPVERADGQPLETRNRVTLCRCGRSETKPLCDGEHRVDPEAGS